MSILRAAVVADLHAYVEPLTDGRTAPSHLHTGLERDNPVQHPISGLIDLIARERLTADLLLSCGDMGDRARTTAIIYAWEEIQRVATALGGARVIATAGNHDLDSRHGTSEPNLRAALQSLVPPFPTDIIDQNTNYWAYHHAIVIGPNYRVLTLNSCADHENPAEIEHGRVERRTTDRIRATLAASPTEPIQLAICHHHPHRFGDIDLEDYSELLGGQYLLHALGSGDYGAWTVVHGHKHLPHLCYAAGGAMSPVIFSAGSLTSSLYLDLQTRARNQFYVIEFDTDAAARIGTDVAATFKSFDWAVGLGWTPAQPGSGLPQAGGFGFRTNPRSLASLVSTMVNAHNPISWEELSRDAPSVRHLIPADVAALRRALESAGLLVSGPPGTIEQVARL
jgi:hypothetical protein